MVQRILVISWDGATFDVLKPLVAQGYMPHFADLMKTGASGRLRSSIPPVTAAAWSSFQTGRNPAKHGIFDFLAYQPGNYKTGLVNASSLRAEPLWTTLSQAAKRCIVINVPVTYPPRPVNGLLVSGLLTPGLQSDYTYPDTLKVDLAQRWDYAIYVYPLTFWQKGAVAFLEDLIRMESTRLELARELAVEETWEFLMVHVQSLDTLQHMLWDRLERLANEGMVQDQVDRLLLDFLTMIDDGLAALVDLLEDDDYLLLLSDHGFGPVTQTLHVNDWLRENGFLKTRAGGKTLQWISRARRGLKKLDILNLRWSSRFLHRGHAWQRLKQRELSTIADWSRTQAFALMGSSCAGIYLNLAGREPAGIVDPSAYEKTKQTLIQSIHDSVMLTGVRAYPREALYSGPYLELMPDVVLVPAAGHHVATDFSENGQIYLPSIKQTGDHRPDGILVMSGPGIETNSLSNVSIYDMAPTILHLFGLPIPADMDGRVVGVQSEGAESDTTERTDGKQSATDYAPFLPEEDEAVRRRLSDLGYLD